MVLSGKSHKKFRMDNLILLVCLAIVMIMVNCNEPLSEDTNKCEDNFCLVKDKGNSHEEVSTEVSLVLKNVFNTLENNSDAKSSAESENILSSNQKTKKRVVLENFYVPLNASPNSKSNQVEIFNNTENISFNLSNVTEAFNDYILEENEETTTTFFTSTETSDSSQKKSMPITFPPPSSEFIAVHNMNENTGVCSCDLRVNECDINCCCDRDCKNYHLMVFTKCKESNTQYDPKYCFRSNFIFSNNFNHKIIKDEGGLFCVVKDNSQITYYKAKEIVTTVDSFNRNLPKKFYSFMHRYPKKYDFKVKEYKYGSLIWIIENGQIKPFSIPASNMGLLCISHSNIKFLIDTKTLCYYSKSQSENGCENLKGSNIFDHMKEIKIISNPGMLNISQKQNFSKICEHETCIEVSLYLCRSSDSFPNCIKISEKTKNLTAVECWNTLPKIYYYIWHNGTEGIKKFEAFVWLPGGSNQFYKHFFQITNVKFLWIGSSAKSFKKSGNPGYVTGKPLLAGKKVYYVTNATTEKKEAIEMTLDSKDWLNVLGSEKGICSSKRRIPVNFRENGHYTCALILEKDSFGKDGCLKLQNYIYNLLIDEDIVNATNNNYFNKYVGSFGNSRIEETGSWAQVLIDLFPVISSQVNFKSNYNSLVCKNIITDLYIDIAYSNIGSFSNPQSKILGVLFHFGEIKDAVYICGNLGCKNNSTAVQYLKLSSIVNFIDTTESSVDFYAEPLGVEVKFPYDFFYPFFSKGSQCSCLSIYVILLFLIFL